MFQSYGNSDDIRYIEAFYNGVRVVAARMPDNTYTVSRILDTSPKLFLDPALQPGSVMDVRKLKIIE